MRINTTSVIALGAVSLGLFDVSATQLSGTINFGSTSPIQLNAPTFPAVTAVDFQSPPGVPNAVVIPGSTGSFTPLVGQLAMFQDFTIGSSTPNEWILTTAPGYTFDLTTSGNFSANNMFLNIFGTGVVHAPGYENTPGTFTLTASRSGGNGQVNFSFAASTSANPTPDGGATALLLGAGLVGIGAVARRKN
jgi:hypothetical protein